jgi:hypothetical protein
MLDEIRALVQGEVVESQGGSQACNFVMVPQMFTWVGA